MTALFLRPDADQSDGSWLNEAASNTNLFNSVDESSFSDTDFIKSSSTSGDKVRLRLSDPGATVSAPMIVRYRCKKDGPAATNIIGRLFQGTAPGTQIATFTQLVTTTFTTYTYTLTTPEFSSISDFNDLYIEFEYNTDWWLTSASVDLWFANSLYYDSGAGGTGQAVTTYLSCTRASTGYAKNADGTLTSFATNTLRIGVGTGLLIEDARTNVIAGSQDVSIWSPLNVTLTQNAAAAPDGTSTADLVVATAATAEHYVRQSSTPTTMSAGAVTWSAYFKPAGYNYAILLVYDTSAGNYVYVFIDLVGVTVSSTTTGGSPTGTSFSVEAMANGWVRAVGTMTVGASANVTIGLQVSNGSGSSNFTGDGVSGIYVWGAQIEQGAFVSSYVPTTGAAATRAAENITTSGSLQTAINVATGSLVAQTDSGGSSSFAANIVDSNGTNLLGFDASNHALASITATLATGNTANRTTQDKMGLAWTSSARSLVLNGGTVATDASSQTPSATQHIGSSGSTNFAFAYVERLSAWTTKLADATLQGFTT